MYVALKNYADFLLKHNSKQFSNAQVRTNVIYLYFFKT